MITEARLFAGGDWVDGEASIDIVDKFSEQPIGIAHVPSRKQADAAVEQLAADWDCTQLTPYERFVILAEASRLIEVRADQFVEAMALEAGFTAADASREVARAAQTLLLSGEEAKRISGELVPMAGAPGSESRIAFTLRFPLGIVCAITPFNSPLNTVAHKVAPAIAAGNSVVLKPSSFTPLTAELLVRLLLDAGLPRERIALLHGEGASTGRWLIENPLPAFYAFTGSTSVGEQIRRVIGLRRSQLELGSISSTIVCGDADIDSCVSKCVNAAFRKAGQVCTSIQRLYVQDTIDEEVTKAIGTALDGKQAGDPRSPSSFIGPLISTHAADRVEASISAALDGGARLVAGGDRKGPLIQPTVLTDVDPGMSVMSEEVFGPVVCIRPFGELDEAIDEVNATPYGLAAGIFTRDLDQALRAARKLQMGSVHVNETSSSRVDLMPYSGVKASGIGTEGPRYAIREMTEERLVTIGYASQHSPNE